MIFPHLQVIFPHHLVQKYHYLLRSPHSDISVPNSAEISLEGVEISALNNKQYWLMGINCPPTVIERMIKRLQMEWSSKDSWANCIFPPLSMWLFQSPPLSIKMSNVPIYLLEMSKLSRTVYFSVKSKQNIGEMSKIPPLKLI
jgi:hypothetical protein